MRRGDHPDVDGRRFRGPERRHLALGQHAQQAGLGGERHVADLVEEERAAIGLLNEAGPGLGRPGEGAGLVAEQLGLDQGLGQGRAIDRDEGLVGAPRRAVQGAGEELLAGAGLAADEEAHPGLEQAGGLAGHPRQHRVAAGEVRGGGPRGGGGRGAHRGGGRLQSEGVEALAAAQAQHPPLHRHRPGEARQVVDRGLEQRVEAQPEAGMRQVGGPARAVQGAVDQRPGPAVETEDAPARIDRQRQLGLDVGEFRRARQVEDPLAPEAVVQARGLDAVGERGDELEREVLARLRGRRLQGRDVEHRGERAVGGVDRGRRAGEPDMVAGEVVVEVDRQGLAGGDAGADRAGAGEVLVPVRAAIEAGAAQVAVAAGIADEVDGDAAGIGEDQHVAEARDLPVQRLDPEARHPDQVVEGVAVLAQARLGVDVGPPGRRGIEPVLGQAPLPRLVDERVAHSLAAARRPDELVDVGHHGRPHRILPDPVRAILRANRESGKIGGAGRPPPFAPPRRRAR